MPDMLIVPTLKLGHPVLLFVLVKAHNALVHARRQLIRLTLADRHLRECFAS